MRRWHLRQRNAVERHPCGSFWSRQSTSGIRVLHRRPKPQGARVARRFARVARILLAAKAAVGPRRGTRGGGDASGGRRVLANPAAAEPAGCERVPSECPASLPRGTSHTLRAACQEVQGPRSPAPAVLDRVSCISSRDRVLDAPRTSPARPRDLLSTRPWMAT